MIMQIMIYLLQILISPVQSMRSCVPPNSETLIGNFKIENETLNWNLETPVWNLKKFFQIFPETSY